MSFQPIHTPTPSSLLGMIRYSLCVLVSAIAIALALDSGYNFLRMVRIINERIVFQGGTFDFFGWKYTVFWAALTVFIPLAVAVIAWHFRKEIKS